MILLLNVLFGLLAGWLTLWLASEVGMPRKPAVIVAVIVGIVVAFADLGARALN